MMYLHDTQEAAKHEPGIGMITDPPPEPLLTKDDPHPWQRMENYLESRGISSSTARYNGCYPIWRKGLRLYVPAQTRVARHHYWQARSMDGHELRYDSPIGPRRDALIVTRSWSSPKQRIRLAIVEGPLDALAVAECRGFIGIALMGIKPPEEALTHLAYIINRMKPQDILCVADRDSVGEMARVQGRLAARGYLSELRIPFGFKDVCEGAQAQREELLR